METNSKTNPGYIIRDHTAIITIPAFDGTLETETFVYAFKDICTELESNDQIRAVILTSAMTADSKSDVQTRTDLPLTSELIEHIDRPTIAAIENDAIGTGLELALACDLRIASRKSYFSLPQIGAGSIPHNGGTQTLPRLIGKGRALQMILTGDSIGADEAFRIGLINMVEPPGMAMQKAMELAADMSKKAPISLRFTREAIRKGMDLTLDQGLTMEGDLYLLLYSTTDRIEGIEAFKEKRDPSFEGK
ncbi:MAG TPA: enoyl-CoA hydratase-related protein [Syntrophorhabdaceae bacterium]|nr:enoyl-CoA hydratase-related protein [Syntrophorhabdaceae bacterium]